MAGLVRWRNYNALSLVNPMLKFRLEIIFVGIHVIRLDSTRCKANTPHDRRATGSPLTALQVVEVDDPYEVGAKITAVQRHDVLSHMHAHGMIDGAQNKAGLRYQQLTERAQIGAMQSADLKRPRVDCGRPDPLSEAVLVAQEELSHLNTALGKFGSALVQDILILGYSVEQAGTARGAHAVREQRYIGSRFRECLETLALELKLIP